MGVSQADVSQIMIDRVKSAREEAKRAEKSYDFAAEMIEIKSQGSIDLFGGNATSRVVEIASDARDAVEELYSSYQTLIQMLDAELRPLLAEGPSTRAVKEVYECIRYLNEESKISTNFSGSLNGSSFGQMASEKLSPTMECRMIEKFWEQTYRAMPGTAEEDRAFAQRQAAERRAAAEAARAEREALRAYERQERERERKEKEQAEERRTREEAELAGSIAALRKAATWASGRATCETGGFASAFVAVDKDGQVHVEADRMDDAALARAQAWRGIEKLLTTGEVIFGLTSDGSVMVAGKGSLHGETGCAGWTGLKDLVLGDYTTLGLSRDGRVYATGESRRAHANSTVPAPFTWTDMDAIWAGGSDDVVGRRRDGSVVTVSYNYYVRSDAGPWAPSEGLVMAAMSANSKGAYLLENGRVETFGGAVSPDNLADKAGIIHICVLGGHVVATYHDGTVRVGKTRKDDAFARKIESFVKQQGIDGHVLCVVGCQGHAVFVTREGEAYQWVDRTLSNLRGGKVEGLRLFEGLDEAIDRARDPEKYRRLAQEAQERLRSERRAAGVCQSCGAPFKKLLFFSVCSSCGARKDY